jgi:hypothetical protein
VLAYATTAQPVAARRRVQVAWRSRAAGSSVFFDERLFTAFGLPLTLPP